MVTSIYTVWSYDGSIAYFGLQHSILLLVAASVLLVLWLPYTCVLLFAQYLQRCRMWKISRIVSKMQPLIDAHCGPFRDKYRYWFGGLLVARAIPLLVGVVNADQNTVVSTIVMVGVLLLLLNRVYRKFYVYLSEVVFLLNLLFWLDLLSMRRLLADPSTIKPSLAGHTYLRAHFGGARKERGSGKNTYGVNGQVFVR